ncbi:fatty acyl-AMP ligase [Streptomyces sp. NPDC051776]|uniref:fatty acyl-AMP ligase n=1 Tax=Streptomyces sp. NPDC051776 TaxID=3155414 RepID=UPI00344AF227
MTRTLVESLLTHAAQQSDRTAYRFLVTGDCDGEIHEMSYGKLALRSRAIAAWLQQRGLTGERALLLYPPGVEFIPAFMGCLAAGVIAVPGVPPQGRAQNHRALNRMRRLIADADAKVILGSQGFMDIVELLAQQAPELDGTVRVATEDISEEQAGSWRQPDLAADTVAFLQYTSGSTSAPRGVMVTHENLVDNQRVLTERMGHTPDSLAEYGNELFVSWLPVYHDMGLIAPVLNTIHLGATSTLFAPLHFLQQPQRWLTTISRFRPHTSGGPNFAYELCLKHATPELLDSLDLSAWRVAFNGAEPVRAATLRRFADTFARAGLRREALYPCYGLAEATLMVTGGCVDTPPTLHTAAEGAPNAGEADAAAVSCGRPGPGVTLAIVHPEGQHELPEGEVGEIWVGGASVAKGYWRNIVATREILRAHLPGHQGRFLRTGDCGFLRDGELYVTGRLKDLIVIDGRNHYPQDLELTAELAHPALRPGCTAAFSVDAGAEGEEPVLVAEIVPQAAGETERITDLIRSAVGDSHSLPLNDVVLVHPGTIPKTSSGKIQRHATRTAYLEGTLSLVTALGAG